jgi:hypothetical protein
MRKPDYLVLKQAILDDAFHWGLAEFVAAGNDQAIADAFNSTSVIGAEIVSVDSLDRDAFLTAILPATLSLAGKDAPTQAKWDRLLGLACSASRVSAASWAGLSALAVADGILTADYAASIFTRTGSQAEVLWGAGTVFSSSDISFTLRGTR